jgi:hypothetical protein
VFFFFHFADVPQNLFFVSENVMLNIPNLIMALSGPLLDNSFCGISIAIFIYLNQFREGNTQ